MVSHAKDWQCSSARSQIAEKRQKNNQLAAVEALAGYISNWRVMLRDDVGAGKVDSDTAISVNAIKARPQTGPPLAAPEYNAAQATEGIFALRKPGSGPSIHVDD